MSRRARQFFSGTISCNKNNKSNFCVSGGQGGLPTASPFPSLFPLPFSPCSRAWCCLRELSWERKGEGRRDTGRLNVTLCPEIRLREQRRSRRKDVVWCHRGLHTQSITAYAAHADTHIHTSTHTYGTDSAIAHEPGPHQGPNATYAEPPPALRTLCRPAHTRTHGRARLPDLCVIEHGI